MPDKAKAVMHRRMAEPGSADDDSEWHRAARGRRRARRRRDPRRAVDGAPGSV